MPETNKFCFFKAILLGKLLELATPQKRRHLLHQLLDQGKSEPPDYYTPSIMLKYICYKGRPILQRLGGKAFFKP